MVSKFAQAKKVMFQVLTQPSAPAVASFLSPIQKTALTLPAAAFLMPMALPGFATLYTYACVSSEPDAQCRPSAVHASAWMRPLWKDQRAVTVVRSAALYSTTLPLDCVCGEKGKGCEWHHEVDRHGEGVSEKYLRRQTRAASRQERTRAR